MRIFRKKPVLVEAEQITSALLVKAVVGLATLPAGLCLKRECFATAPLPNILDAYPHVHFGSDSICRLELGDWMVKAVGADRWVIDRQTFIRDYEWVIGDEHGEVVDEQGVK